MNLNLPPSFYNLVQNEDFNQTLSSSSSFPCHTSFDSTRDDEIRDYRDEFFQPHRQHQEDEKYAYDCESYEVVNNDENILILSKTESIHKAKPSDQTRLKLSSSCKRKFEDQKVQSFPLAADLSSCNSSSNKNMNNPIRVCSDCNTTKTPLWRSGPKGPKSLCNACGIRQRKARRAIAVANGTLLTTEMQAMKIKLHQKEKTGKNGRISQHKKRFKVGAGSSNGQKKLDFEDFLINLSKDLAFRYRVFPQDEKEAAMLLMALSSGLVHGQVFST